MIWFWLALAVAAPSQVDVVVPDGTITPASPSRILVACTDHAGKPVKPDSVAVDKGSLLLEADARDRASVYRYIYTPPATVGPVRFTVRADGQEHVIPAMVDARPASSLRVATRVNGVVGQRVQFDVLGDDLRVQDVIVRTGEPAGIEVRVLESGQGVRVAVQPTGQGARVLLASVSDRHGSPKLVRIYLRERLERTFDLEVGARLDVAVGSREYGPFVAGDDGKVRAVWEQLPGEAQALLTTSDELGNRTQNAYPMAAPPPAPLLSVVGDSWPGDLPPTVLLHAAAPDGSPTSRSTPRCRAPGTGELPVKRMAAGRWVVVVPPRPVGGLDLRVSCQVGAGRTDLRVPAPVGRPHRLVLKAWPEDLSTDFPVSEVTAHLEDVRGERLTAASLEVTADRGVVILEPGPGPSRRGEYQGGIDAVREGYDTIRAVWRLPPGDHPIHRVLVARGPVDGVGGIAVHGRALDHLGRPLAGVPILLSVGAESAVVSSAEDGWATAILAHGDRSLLTLTARVDGLERRTLVHVSDALQTTGPGLPDLDANASVRLTAGRVSTVKLALDTSVLFTAPEATLRVRIYLYDRAENLVTDEIPVLTATAGNLGPPRRTPDGGFEAEYTPPPGGRAQTVSIIARSPTGSAAGAQELRLEPQPVLAAVGVGMGLLSNLSADGINAITFSVNGEKRLPVFNDQLMARIDVSGYTTARTVTSNGEEVRKRLTLVPVTAAALARKDWGRNATWLGLGVTLAPYASREQRGEHQRAAKVGVLPPGFSVMLGAARRYGVNELMFEVGGMFLASSAGDSGFQGQVGGIRAVMGIRRVID